MVLLKDFRKCMLCYILPAPQAVSCLPLLAKWRWGERLAMTCTAAGQTRVVRALAGHVGPLATSTTLGPGATTARGPLMRLWRAFDKDSPRLPFLVARATCARESAGLGAVDVGDRHSHKLELHIHEAQSREGQWTATTLLAATGRLIPLSVSSPTDSTSTMPSTMAWARWLRRIWSAPACPLSLDARMTTLPIAP